MTTAAAIFATAAIGAAAGEGKFALAALATGLVLIALEIRYLPGLRALDARRWAPRFTHDDEYDPADPPAGDDGHPRRRNPTPPHKQ